MASCALALITVVAEGASVSLEATDNYASEASPPGITNIGLFTFTRTGEVTNALTVHFSVSGTATPLVDYKNISNSITFPAGLASVDLTVEAIYSRDVEPTESVIVTLLASAEYEISASSNATVNIWKNDYNDPSPPTVVIWSDGSGAEQVYPGGFVNTLVFTFYRGGPTNQPLTVAYNLSGTAVPGVDYTGGSSNLITIPPGSNRAYLELTPIDDSIAEGYESVIVGISPSPLYVIGSRAQAVGEIIDNDAGPIPTINREWLSKLNGALTFKVNGTPGQTFLIYDSTNLVDWTLVTANPIPAGGTFIEATNIAPTELRFFRAVLQ